MAEWMKDSGVEWIGLIPDSWEIDRIKYQFSLINGYSFKSDYYSDNGIRVIRISDVEDDYLSDKDVRYYPESFREQIGEAMLKQYDILVSLTGYLGKCYMVKSSDGEMGLNQRVGVLRRIGSKYDSMYMKRVLQCEPFRKEMELSSNGSAQLNMSTDWLKNNSIPKPSLAEQRMIADFLDEKCAKIDKLSEDIKKQIDILEEYKKSVIIRAVTKGLNPNVEMKDSGIEYVGYVPLSWNIHPIYRYFSERRNKNNNGREKNLLSLSYGKIIRKDINTNGGLLPENFNSYNIVEPNDIIIRPTDLQNDKRSLRTGLVNEKGIITSAYISLKPLDNIVSRYYHYLLHAYDTMKVFYNMGNGVRQGLNYQEFSKLLVLEPSIEEQERIADYLDTICEKLNWSISGKIQQIEKLTDYKKSIIYEYVTGKKRVA